MDNLRSRCPACELTANHISDAAFICFQQNAHEITFRARLYVTNEVGVVELNDALRGWVSEGPAVAVTGVLLRVDPNCEVVIASFNSPECTGERAYTPITTPASKHCN